jgi:hypothetical protein
MIHKSVARPKVPTSIESLILTSSARRCALCFWLDLDLKQKKGQIAHLDHNPENNVRENLVFLCLDHHSEYDSTTSQHKNYTIYEVKAARVRLYQAIEARPHTPSPQPTPRIEPARGDTETLKDLLEVLPSGGGISFVRDFSAGDKSFDREKLRDLRTFSYTRSGPDHEFLDAALEALRKDLREAIDEFLSSNTWVTEGSRCSVPEEWRYDQPERFKRAVSEIDNAAEAVCQAYDVVVRRACEKLLK